MADQPAALASIYEVAQTIERARVRYAFIGGVAVLAWGVPRATFDLDVAATVPGDGVRTLLASFSDRGYVVDDVFAGGYRDRLAGMQKIHVQIPAGSSLMTVVVFLKSTPFLKSVLERRTAVELGLGSVFVCTAADLLLFKLVAYRFKDRADIENVLTVQGVPEREYLEAWAEKLGVRERLAEVLHDTR